MPGRCCRRLKKWGKKMKTARILIKVITIDDEIYNVKTIDLDNSEDVTKQIKEFFDAFWIVTKSEMKSDLHGMRIGNVKIVETIESDINIDAIHGISEGEI